MTADQLLSLISGLNNHPTTLRVESGRFPKMNAYSHALSLGVGVSPSWLGNTHCGELPPSWGFIGIIVLVLRYGWEGGFTMAWRILGSLPDYP